MIKVLVPNFREEVQNHGPQYQRKGISISESKISKNWDYQYLNPKYQRIGIINIRIQNIKEGQSESGATLCGGDRHHQPTARHLGHCCHYDDDHFGYDDDVDDEYIRTEEEEESTWFTYLLWSKTICLQIFVLA